MQRFKDATFSASSDPLVFATSLRRDLSRALPNLDKSSSEAMLQDKFLNAMPTQIANQLKLTTLVHPMRLQEMTETVCTLAGEQDQVASVEPSEDDSKW